MIEDAITRLNEMSKLFHERTHASAVIAAAALLDNQLELCIKAVMRPLPKKLYAELFDQMRPLGSFSSKITMAYALEIIAKDVHDDLQTIRKLRNTFAHTEELLHFGSVPIAPLFERIRQSLRPKENPALFQFIECFNAIDASLKDYLKNVKSP